jgi:hypothetical protein
MESVEQVNRVHQRIALVVLLLGRISASVTEVPAFVPGADGIEGVESAICGWACS